MTPWYSDAEIDSLCEGLAQNAAKVRYLESLGLHVTRKYNGRPLVMRAHAEAVLAGAREISAGPPAAAAANGPDRGALITFLATHQAKRRKA